MLSAKHGAGGAPPAPIGFNGGGKAEILDLHEPKQLFNLRLNMAEITLS